MTEQSQQSELLDGMSIVNGILKTEVGAWKLDLISSVKLLVVKERIFLAGLISSLCVFIGGVANPGLTSVLPVIWALVFFGILGSGHVSIIINSAGIENTIWRKSIAWFQARKVEAEGTAIVNVITSAMSQNCCTIEAPTNAN